MKTSVIVATVLVCAGIGCVLVHRLSGPVALVRVSTSRSAR